MISGSDISSRPPRTRTLLALFGEAALRRRAANVGHLLTGTFVTMAITLVSVALAARSLGPHDYGVLALILNSAQAIERLVSFQSWQPLIRYGAVLDGPEHRQDLLSLLKFGLLLDVAGAVAGWLLASALALIAQFFFDIDRATMILALMFACTLLFNLNGMPTAEFRLNDRFRIVATLQVLNAAIRLACQCLPPPPFHGGNALRLLIRACRST